MTDRPILFSEPMVRALLEGRKKQTRRILTAASDEPPAYVSDGVAKACDERGREYRWPRTHAVGDRLWVREAFSYEALDVDRNGFMPPWYWADGYPTNGDFTKPKPSIHMPRWASRLTLVVTDVRVERLQDISEADAIAEGVECDSDGWRDYLMPSTQCCVTARDSFRTLWTSINGPGAWDTNPWVAAYSFEVHRCNIDQMPEPA